MTILCDNCIHTEMTFCQRIILAELVKTPNTCSLIQAGSPVAMIFSGLENAFSIFRGLHDFQT